LTKHSMSGIFNKTDFCVTYMTMHLVSNRICTGTNMGKFVFSKIFIIAALTASLLSSGAQHVFCEDQTITVVSEEPVVLAPDGLETREQAQLEQRYRYEFRNKDLILRPGISTPVTDEPLISNIMGAGPMSEEEKLYRYFGVATLLREAGKVEEAVEVLKYIAEKRPTDRYLANYLKETQRELHLQESKWKQGHRRDAEVLKRIQVQSLMEDGKAYYAQKDYDNALLSFNDTLTLDPGNSVAKKYMEKLKVYYRNETAVDNIVMSDWGVTGDPGRAALSEENGDISNGVRKAAARMLSQHETTTDIVKYARVTSLMDEAELELRISEIINQRRAQERREFSYTLGTGDAVRISVQDHPELSGESLVGLEGYIMLPLVNEPLRAKGLTLGELQDEVTTVLQRYVQDPVAYVGISRYESKIFYVIDEAGCTPYSITRANFTLRDALFTSDWGSNRALGRVLIIKPHKLHPVVKQVDAFDLIYRGNLSRNIRVEDGDVIYVPMTAASKISDTIADMLSPIKAVKDVRDEWIDQRWNIHDGWMNLPRIPRNAAQQSDYRETPTN
jgi:protein involved in polysaccharide export with SLBB domain